MSRGWPERHRGKIQIALERASVEFIDENGGGSGVRPQSAWRGRPERKMRAAVGPNGSPVASGAAERESFEWRQLAAGPHDVVTGDFDRGDARRDVTPDRLAAKP